MNDFLSEKATILRYNNNKKKTKEKQLQQSGKNTILC